MAEPETPEGIEKFLSELVAGKPDSISPLPVHDLYEVIYGQEVLYLSKDGRYLFRGDILDLKERRIFISEKRAAAIKKANAARIKAIEGLGEDGMIVYGPKDARHTITVFTDIDCPYCVKFHQEVPQLTKSGVKVRYLAYPRAGIGSGSYQKSVNVWCAKDRQQAMTDAKAGRQIAKNTCDNPVAEHFKMGKTAGVTGTPTMVLETGRVVPGYVPAKRLISALEKTEQ